MRYGNRQQKWKKVISSPFMIVGLLILAFFLSKAVTNIGDKATKIDQKLANANNEYARLVERERVLRERVEFLSTDEGKESELRSKYRAVADGEKVAVIIDESDASTTATTTAEKRGWWKKVRSLIGL